MREIVKKIIAVFLVLLILTGCSSEAPKSIVSEVNETSNISESTTSLEIVFIEQNQIPNIATNDENDPYVRLLRDKHEWTAEDIVFLLNIPRIEHYGIWGRLNEATHNGYVIRFPSTLWHRVYINMEGFARLVFKNDMYDSSNFYDKPLMVCFEPYEFPLIDIGNYYTAGDVFNELGIGEIRYTDFNWQQSSIGVGPVNYGYWLRYKQDGLVYIFELTIMPQNGTEFPNSTTALSDEEIMELDVWMVYVFLEDTILYDNPGNCLNY